MNHTLHPGLLQILAGSFDLPTISTLIHFHKPPSIFNIQQSQYWLLGPPDPPKINKFLSSNITWVCPNLPFGFGPAKNETFFSITEWLFSRFLLPWTSCLYQVHVSKCNFQISLDFSQCTAVLGFCRPPKMIIHSPSTETEWPATGGGVLIVLIHVHLLAVMS